MFTNRQNIKNILDKIVLILGCTSFVSIIMVMGFYLNDLWFGIFKKIADTTLIIFVLQEIIRFLIDSKKRDFLKERKIEVSIAILIFFRIIFPEESLVLISYFLPELSITELTLMFISISQLFVLFSFFVRTLRHNKILHLLNLNSGALISISFLIVITTGTLILMLPRAVNSGYSLSFIDALFTSTSAVCVTGLVVVDTSTHFSPIGRIFLVLLIQIGGLGLMTFTTFFATVFAGNLSLRVNMFLKDLLSQDTITEGTELLKRIFIFTIIVEYIGSFLLYFSLGGTIFDFDKHLYYDCLFHSISAFCNAGFSLYSDGLMFSTIQTNYIYSSIIMFLIVLGGLGFFTLSDVTKRMIKRKLKLRLTSKIVLITTAFLIITGFLVFSIFESNNLEFRTAFDFFFQPLFLSITSRTAGFNTISTELLQPSTAMFLIILMWIGASPGSTGGGIKTTTFAISIIALYNILKGKSRIEIFNRELNIENIKQALLVIISSLLFLGIGSTLLVWSEKALNPLDLIFEATSAISTVGLTRNITPHLSVTGKMIIIVLMYVGRIGVLSFLLAFHKHGHEPNYKLSNEKIMIG